MIAAPGRRRDLGRLGRRWAVVAFASLGYALLWVGALTAQDPPDSVRVVPDTMAVDSLAADSLLANTLFADSLLADSLLADSLRADSLAIDTLPLFDRGSPSTPEAGVWEWDEEALFWVSGFTLADLVRDVPGVWVTRAGDYGAPATTLGFGTGRLRVRIDGVEWMPYEAGVVDLSQVPLTGLRTVRVRRGVGGLTIDLYSLRSEDARAYSIIEAGTGDLQTNLFRGTFLLPRALGGSLSGVLERVDTQGDGNEEPGALTGIWLRYTLNRSRRGGVEVDYRNRRSTQELFTPNEIARQDFTLRGRYLLSEGAVLGAHYTSSGIEGTGGALVDTTTGGALTVGGEDVRQLGLDFSVRRGGFWGRAGYRNLSGEGVPSSLIDVDAGIADQRWGGVGIELNRQGWDGESTSRNSFRAWTTDRYLAYGFLELDRGSTGIPYLPLLAGGLVQLDTAGVPSPVPGTLRVQERNTRRLGAGLRWRGLELEGARVSIEADSVYPLGLPTDRGPFAVPGGERTGLEVRAHVPLLLLDNLEFRGSAVKWDELAPDSLGVVALDPWPYLPSITYDARLHYRNTFLPTGNFELLAAVGVRERDPMTVFSPVDTLFAMAEGEDPPVVSPTTLVPFSQTWYARLEMRIVSLRVFIEWENLTLRDANQDFPDRIYPRTRAMYGVRWTLHN